MPTGLSYLKIFFFFSIFCRCLALFILFFFTVVQIWCKMFIFLFFLRKKKKGNITALIRCHGLQQNATSNLTHLIYLSFSGDAKHGLVKRNVHFQGTELYKSKWSCLLHQLGSILNFWRRNSSLSEKTTFPKGLPVQAIKHEVMKVVSIWRKKKRQVYPFSYT